ncbi:hypothetical protein E0198_004031 [Clavispora lusitaniae]|nr:hypothetical protein E0198_004031 [Clavispora lusitaniae]
MDITAFAPVSDTFVLAGDATSQLALFRVPDAWEDAERIWSDPGDADNHARDAIGTTSISAMDTAHRTNIGRTNTSSDTSSALSQCAEGTIEAGVGARLTRGPPLGKVSRAPVADVSSLGALAVAASSTTVSTWDLGAGRRDAVYFATKTTARGAFWRPNMAAAGTLEAIHLFDLRSAGESPAASIKVARDNVYALSCSREGTLFTGGADGSVCVVDLRAQRAHTCAIPGQRGAVLDVRPVTNGVVATMENGSVCQVPESGRTLGFDVAVDAFKHRVSGDVAESPHGLRVAVGSDYGYVWVVDGARRRRMQLEARVPAVRWGPRGLYACAAEKLFVVAQPEF